MKITSKYPCSQPDLYQICLLIALSCKSKLAEFILFSGSYSLPAIEAVILAINQAEQLPGEEARAEKHKMLNKQLVPISKEGLKLWQYLKRYISKLYSDNPGMQRAAFEAAGWNFYDSNNAWPETKACLIMGSEYIKLHRTELLANDNMPADFEERYNAQMGLFQTTYTDFLLAEQEAVVGTDAKISANNAIYDKIITICLDGQVIFEGNDTLQGQFSFEKVSQLISHQGPSAVKFHVTNTDSGLPIAGVEISLTGTDKKVTTNEQGDAEMNQLSSGDAEFVLKADGFPDKTVSLVLSGTTKHEDVSMEPMFTGEMSVGAQASTPQPENQPQPANS